MKPPNIVIFSERNDSVQKWKYLLDKVLSREMYVIYKLPKSEFIKSNWMSNVSLLVIDQFEKFSADDKEQFDNYLIAGGSAFLHCSMNPSDMKNKDLLWNAKVTELSSVQCAFQYNGVTQIEVLVNKALLKTIGKLIDQLHYHVGLSEAGGLGGWGASELQLPIIW